MNFRCGAPELRAHHVRTRKSFSFHPFRVRAIVRGVRVRSPRGHVCSSRFVTRIPEWETMSGLYSVRISSERFASRANAGRYVRPRARRCARSPRSARIWTRNKRNTNEGKKKKWLSYESGEPERKPGRVVLPSEKGQWSLRIPVDWPMITVLLWRVLSRRRTRSYIAHDRASTRVCVYMWRAHRFMARPAIPAASTAKREGKTAPTVFDESDRFSCDKLVICSLKCYSVNISRRACRSSFG